MKRRNFLKFIGILPAVSAAGFLLGKENITNNIQDTIEDISKDVIHSKRNEAIIALAESMRLTKEHHTANVLNRAFNSQL